MENNILTLNHITAGYGAEPVLVDVSLEINHLDFLGIIGPNGGGKTTLLKVMMGLIRPMAGSISCLPESAYPGRSLFGYLPQVNRTDRKFPITVSDVVLSGAMKKNSMTALRKRFFRSRAEELMERTGLTPFRKKMVGDLSGGQMQRVFLARAMLSSPLLLVLDEPNSFVDNTFEKDLYDLLMELNRETAIIVVSHDLGMVASYVKSIACVNRGLHYHPSNIITQELLASYECPIDLITHGKLPHRVLEDHK
ncbi:MAG TPA: ABC transporter ATP-binding protein [Bacteroidales bacterium]|nr:ABC transporter ATP-binding protein [Bacteroidales bacterium]HSA42531.1 ABC transporter ATP-binding protein [Bacteroidales bacterium]